MKRKERLAFVRRALLLEGLEQRSMLSGMVGDSPWQNPLDAADLNCDGTVSPSDALAAINAINGGVSIDASGKMAPPQLGGEFETADTSFLDANGDGQLSPSDALAVINAINANGGTPASDVTVPDQPGAPGPDAQVIDVSNGFAHVRGVISDATDVDVFQVAPTKSELNVALFSHGGGAVSVTIVDGAGTTFGSAAIDAGTHHPAKVDLQVETGKTYYLQVKGDGGPYALGVLNFEPDDFTAETDSPLGTDIHSDTIANAGALMLNHGHARVVSNIDAAGDADVFAVTADVDGKLVVEADGEIPLSVDVSDTNGSLGTFTTADHHAIVVNATAGSIYYVTVTSANGTSIGAYEMNVVNAPVGPPGDDDGPPEQDHGPPTPAAFFAKIDADGDGFISPTEFEDAVPGKQDLVADHVFANWDTDKSGTLSLDEFVAGLSTLPQILPHHSEPGPEGPLVTGD